MRVFVGTANITDAPGLLRKGFRKLGIDADIGLINCHHRFYGVDKDVDVDLSSLSSVKVSVCEDGSIKVCPPDEFRDIILKYDVFVFIASSSFLPKMCDLQVLREMGKTVVCYQTGSEVRHELTGSPFWKRYGHTFPVQAYQTHKDADDHITPWWKCSPYMHTLTNKMYNTRLAEKFATTICTHSSIFTLGIRPHMTIQLPMDEKLCSFKIPRHKVPVVVHAPSNRAVKRTDFILKILAELAEEGIAFQLYLVENMPNTEVLRLLSEADVLIDQIGCGALGRLGLEGFASGCAVVSGNSSAVPWPPHRPALSVRPDNFKERVRELLTNPMLRLRLAAEGREYIEKGYHSPEGAAQAILDAIENEKTGDYDYYPTVFTEEAHGVAEEPTPPFLQKMTLDILKKHGTHPDTSLKRLAQEGFLPVGVDEDVPRWNLDTLHKVGEWNWCSKRIPKPDFENMYMGD